jgi:hypothetical protein
MRKLLTASLLVFLTCPPATADSDFDMLVNVVYKLATVVHQDRQEIRLLKQQVRNLQKQIDQLKIQRALSQTEPQNDPPKPNCECRKEVQAKSFVVATFVKPDPYRIWRFIRHIEKRFHLTPRIALSKKHHYVVVAVKTDRETAKKIARDAFYSTIYDYDHMIEVSSPEEIEQLLNPVEG